MSVAGAAPSTLQGAIAITGNAGGAYLNYQAAGSGITQIGDGPGSLTLEGSNAFIGSGSSSAPTSNSALKNLETIAGNGTLFLLDGATVNTTPSSGTFTNAGTLGVGDSGVTSGSSITIDGNLANSGAMLVGGSSASGLVDVTGTFSQTGGTTTLNGALTASAANFTGGTLLVPAARSRAASQTAAQSFNPVQPQPRAH